MPKKVYYALKVTLDNLDTIANANAGLRPKVQKKITYFVTPADPNESSVIVDRETFQAHYKFVEPEREREFTEVREIR